nr:hypothetical protein BaRGS_030548 [Batillaria attramentaria]
MTDFYNAFLAMLAFDQHPDDVTILWVDAHPKGGLDDVWTTLFGRAYRAARLPGPTRNYVAHPRNKGGSVSRKIFNETS